MTVATKHILITGADGFIGKNLVVRLKELPNITVSKFVRGDDFHRLPSLVEHADVVVHLAGENRPVDDIFFTKVNTELTVLLCNEIQQKYKICCRHTPLIFSSSTQALVDNPYGRSKLEAEKVMHKLAQNTSNPCLVFRFPGVFGKWGKPNYNSVVTTFSYNISRGLSIKINDSTSSLQLVYIDDVVTALLAAIDAPLPGFTFSSVAPQYTITLGELASKLHFFDDCRLTLKTESVGTGLNRALYATYLSYLPNVKFSYKVPQYNDERGVFVEMLKTPDSGQLSYFVTHPGMTRGGHYHHTKTEKFLVIKGDALFRFRHLLTGELVELTTNGVNPQVVDTIPGWSHEIMNVGDEDMVVMLWANENFDRQKPDTVASKV